MKAIQNIEITLTLSLEEAQYLKGLVQNSYCKPEDEQIDLKKIRESFWKTLHDLGVKL